MKINEILDVKKHTLLELFDTTVPWRSGRNTETGTYVFKFTAGDIPITVKAAHTGNGEYDFMFSNDNHVSIETTDEGNQYLILSTVSKILKTFIDKVSPNKVYFTASKFNKGRKHKSRANVYAAMAKRNRHEDYDLDIDTSDPDVVLFTYTRKTKNEKIDTGLVTGSVHKIISAWQRADQSDYEYHKSLIDSNTKVADFVEKIAELIGGDQKDKIPPVTFSMINRTPVDTKSKLTIIAFLIVGEDKIPTRIVKNAGPVGESIDTYESFDTQPSAIVDRSDKLVDGSYFYDFVVKGKKYVVEFAKVKKDVFEFDFSTGGNYGLTNERQQMKVFVSVIEVAFKFIKKFKPRILMFTAVPDPNHEDENVRAKVYIRMLDKFLPKEYTYNVHDTGRLVKFKVLRNAVSESFN